MIPEIMGVIIFSAGNSTMRNQFVVVPLLLLFLFVNIPAWAEISCRWG